MSIVRRQNSKYWYIQFQIAGRSFVRSSKSTNKKVAEQLETQLRSQVHSKIYLGDKPTLTLEQALNRFASAKQGTPNHRNIVLHVKAILATIPPLTPLELLNSDHIDQYCHARKADRVTSQTLKHSLSVIRGAITLARRQGYRTADVAFPMVKVSAGRLRYLSDEEEAALLNALDPNRQGRGFSRSHNRQPEIRAALQDLYDLVVLLLDTGARCGEIARLEWKQIDLPSRQIRLWRPKVRNESILFMTERVYAILKRRHAAATSKYVFTNKKGNARTHHRTGWRKAFDRAGLHDCTIHTLRHTHATRLIQNGLSVYEVQTVLGHSDPKTTMRYAHLEQTVVTAKARDVIERLQR